MRVVIAGGSGFLGRAITATLLTAGHSVAVLTRDAQRARSVVDGRVELVEWDGQSLGPWAQALDGAGGLINLAGEPIAAGRWTAERKSHLLATRLTALAALTQALEQTSHRPGVLLNASGVGYYAPAEDAELDEDAPPGSGFLAELCRRREEAARGAERLGMRVVQMRIGIVLSRDNPPLARMLPTFHGFLGGPLGSGRQWWPWIHREDVVELFRFALENEAVQGPLNVTAPEPVTMTAFARTLGRLLGRPSWVAVPAPVLRLLLGEIAGMILASQRVVPRKALRLGYRYRHPRLEPALRSILDSDGGSRPGKR